MTSPLPWHRCGPALVHVAELWSREPVLTGTIEGSRLNYDATFSIVSCHFLSREPAPAARSGLPPRAGPARPRMPIGSAPAGRPEEDRDRGAARTAGRSLAAARQPHRATGRGAHSATPPTLHAARPSLRPGAADAGPTRGGPHISGKTPRTADQLFDLHH